MDFRCKSTTFLANTQIFCLFFLQESHFFCNFARKIPLFMKKITVLSILAVLLCACSGSSDRLLTSATGSIYECLVVGDGAIKTPVCETMGADMYGLPQMEPYFTTMFVPTSQFDDLLKSTRNILIADINPQKYTHIKAIKARDVWSQPQATLRIQAPSDEDFLAYWKQNGEKIREWFVQEELARQLRFYRASTNKDARAKLNRQGYDLLIPEDFMLIMDTTLALNNQRVNVLWCCNNKGPMRKDIVVYNFPYTAQEQFSNDSIIAKRNAILGRLVSAQVEGSHMGTEYKHFPPVSRQVAALRDSVGGFYGMETRGLWKIENGEAMGGPFVSLTRLDQVNGRVVTAETFLYAPGQKKRNALRQDEAILYSLKMPNER